MAAQPGPKAPYPPQCGGTLQTSKTGAWPDRWGGLDLEGGASASGLRVSPSSVDMNDKVFEDLPCSCPNACCHAPSIKPMLPHPHAPLNTPGKACWEETGKISTWSVSKNRPKAKKRNRDGAAGKSWEENSVVLNPHPPRGSEKLQSRGTPSGGGGLTRLQQRQGPPPSAAASNLEAHFFFQSFSAQGRACVPGSAYRCGRFTNSAFCVCGGSATLAVRLVAQLLCGQLHLDLSLGNNGPRLLPSWVIGLHAVCRAVRNCSTANFLKLCSYQHE